MDSSDYAGRLGGRYNFIESRQSGGFAQVDICWDSRMQRRVAIKRISLDGQEPSGALREARTAAMLAHPNIVTVYDFETDSDYAYIIMENVEGLDLYELYREWQAEDAELSYGGIAYLAKSIGDALSFAHENGVLHLDVKPSNILIDRNGRVKLTDFGVAELAGSLGYDAASGGTLGYMSPEQSAGRQVDAASDVYSLASVVYEALTGEAPELLPGRNGLEAPLPPSNWDDSVSEEIDDILLTALDPNPAFRMQSVRDLVDELLEYLGNPALGEQEFAAFMQIPADDESEYPRFQEMSLWAYMEDSAAQRVGLVTMSYPGAADMVMRFAALVVTAFLTYLGLGATGLTDQPAVMAIVTALVAIIGFIVPRAGALLGLLAVGAGAVISGSVLIGVTLMVIIILWWIGEGRLMDHATTVVGSPGLLGLFQGIPLTSLMASLITTPAHAAVMSLITGIVALLLAALTGSDHMGSTGLAIVSNTNGAVNEQALQLLADPRTWILMGGWAITSAAVSATLRTRSTGALFFSPFLGAALLLFTEAIASRMDNNGIWTAPEPLSMVVAVMSGILLLCAIVLFGVPGVGSGDPRSSSEV